MPTIEPAVFSDMFFKRNSKISLPSFYSREWTDIQHTICEKVKTCTLVSLRPRPHSDSQVWAARKAALQKAEVLASIASSPSSSPQMVAEAKTAASLASSALRSAVRRSNLNSAVQRDELLHSVLSSDPSKLYSALTRAQSSGTPALHSLSVGDRTYTGDAVPDGF